MPIGASPVTAWRFAQPSPHPACELNDDPWTKRIIQAVSREAEPIRLTTVVNQVVGGGNYTRRSERVTKKIELFKLIGRLTRMGRLRLVRRRFLTMPADDKKHEDYRASATAPVELPEPCI